MTCPYEDHEIDQITEGRCRYCGEEPEGHVYSWTVRCPVCGAVHPV